jgi:uncharacterized membrane protein
MLLSFNLAPLLQAEPLVQIHTLSAFAALLLGPVSLYGGKGPWHRRIGYLWFLMMGATALSSFGLFGLRLIGPFSPIHLLSVATLATLLRAWLYVKNGRIAAHKRAMTMLYWYGLVTAGLFNFLPGRLINHMVLPKAADWGIALIAMGLLGLALRELLARRRRNVAETT